MNWLKQQAANIAGTAEPIYGPTAIQTVAQRSGGVTHTELKKEDLKWVGMKSTCVETQTFYIFAPDGNKAMLQVIYSNVGGIRTTCQFNSKIFYSDGRPPAWQSDPVHHHQFLDDNLSFKADGCSIDLDAEGTTLTVKSSTNKKSIVDISMTRIAPGFAAGKDGISTFGTDAAAPWGSMKHLFWPRCSVKGQILTPEGPINFDGGRALFIHALQGMKPHHAAARWNFVDFQSPSFSGVMMEFTTPPSYGTTTVNVGGVIKEGEILYAGTTNTAEHTATAADKDIDWPAPTAVDFKWTGQTKDGKPFSAEVMGGLGKRLDRVDVMAEVPGFVKSFVGHAVGTKPYIYQYSPTEKLKFKVVVDGQETIEEGTLYCEATFITA